MSTSATISPACPLSPQEGLAQNRFHCGTQANLLATATPGQVKHHLAVTRLTFEGWNYNMEKRQLHKVHVQFIAAAKTLKEEFQSPQENSRGNSMDFRARYTGDLETAGLGGSQTVLGSNPHSTTHCPCDLEQVI